MDVRLQFQIEAMNAFEACCQNLVTAIMIEVSDPQSVQHRKGLIDLPDSDILA